uniref:NADH-ubiquinone oxidoreductase chain 3 n=2 Tax=Schlettererius cinctipes TaxID=32424 RepID=C4NCG1_9HYME|nr:NADH dehydrogenase subunit 3 [Schlettererius cinctipes]
MLMIYLLFWLMMIIPTIMMIANLILMKKNYMMFNKNSPFECGFDPIKSPRLPFSMNFFLITIIFLIFDIEITIIFPMILCMKYSFSNYWMLTSLFFSLILILSLYLELYEGSLKWIK